MTVRFAVVEIVTADMPRSLAFYRALGMELPAAADQEDHVEYALPGGLRLSWDTPDVMTSFDPDWYPSGAGHSLGLAFACDSPEEVDALYESVTAAGFTGHLAPWDAFWGQRYAVLRDPDLNSVDLFAQLPQ
jgi:catechol 2,3-dioxygenase-like lactoylglutathione lyase family enzyme